MEWNLISIIMIAGRGEAQWWCWRYYKFGREKHGTENWGWQSWEKESKRENAKFVSCVSTID